jgi:Spy/CpxP family protein refolding chaperone
VTVDKPRSNRFPWILGTLALSLTVPVVAGGIRAWGPDPATPPAGQAAGTNPSQGQTATGAPQPTGQRGGGRPDSMRQEWEWWNDAAVKKELALTDAKSREIDRIYQERSRHAKPFYDQLVKEREEQDRMAKERLVDDVTFALQVARVDALFSELRKSRAIMIYRMSRKLTAEQLKKLEEIQDRRNRDGRGRGGGSR